MFNALDKGESRMDVLKVSSKSNPNAVAGALAGAIREKGVAEIQAIGAGAVNQAIKAIAIARGYVAPSGVDLVCIPAFTDVNIDGEERTAIKLIVKPRND
jgi:stage V sporulation protein S